jgi:7-keto-8-aminopelargonate synthetase-like enzyme
VGSGGLWADLCAQQIDLKSKYKFRLILDETCSFGVLGRTGRGITELQHVDSAEVDIIVGSMAGALAGAGGFCAGSDDVVEHQRITAASYTFSAALPAMAAVTVSETVMMLQTQPDLQTQLKENIKTMWGQIDPRSDWVYVMSAKENPVLLLTLKPEVVASRRLGDTEVQGLLQEMVDEVSCVRCDNCDGAVC